MSKPNLRKQKSKSKLQVVFDKGTKFVSNNFVAFFLFSDSEEIPPSTIIVTKKIGNAVKRNRSKRRLREVIRLYIQPQIKPIPASSLASCGAARPGISLVAQHMISPISDFVLVRDDVEIDIQPQIKPIKLIFLARGNTSTSEYASLLKDCNNLIKKINSSVL